MQPGKRHRVITGTAAVGTVAVLVVFGTMWWRQRPAEAYLDMFLLHNGPPSVLLLWMSWLVLVRRPGNAAGRVLLAIGLLGAVHVVFAGFTDARLVAAGVTGRVTDPGLVLAELPLDAAGPLWVMTGCGFLARCLPPRSCC